MLRATLFALIATLLTCLAAAQTPQPQTADILFTHARILAREILDLEGKLYLAPGFIDTHTHTFRGLSSSEMKENLNYLMQGVTTVVSGNDGGSPWPIATTLENWDKNGIGTNGALFVGFGTVRQQVLGMADRAPTPDELKREQDLISQGMRDGAFGMSTGLFYVPQSFSKTDEVIALAKIAGRMGGIYDSHLRDEDSYNIGVKGAVAEAVEIGRQAHLPIMISHIKVLGKGVWGQAPQIVAMIDAARREGINVVANQYPYEASGTAFEAAVLPNWAAEGGREKMLERFRDPAQRSRLVKEI